MAIVVLVIYPSNLVFRCEYLSYNLMGRLSVFSSSLGDGSPSTPHPIPKCHVSDVELFQGFLLWLVQFIHFYVSIHIPTTYLYTYLPRYLSKLLGYM